MRPDYDSYHFSKKEWVMYMALGLLVFLGFGKLLYDSFLTILLFFPACIFYIRWLKNYCVKRQKKQVLSSFLPAADAFVVALRAGFSAEASIREARKDLERLAGEDDGVVRELRFMERQLGLSVPLETLFLDFARRSHLEDIENFAEVFSVGKRTGGNMDEILTMTVSHLKQKLEVQKDIEAEIASRRMELVIMSLIPWGILLYLRVFSGEYVKVLYTSVAGRVVVTVCLAIFIVSLYMGKKITDISV